MAKKILIVNDESDIAEVTKDMLEIEGYDTKIVYSGEEALEWVRQEIPDLILLDLLLMGIQGEDLCVRFKSDSKLKSIPVILFSANDVDIETVARVTGAEDSIMIPYDPDELLGKIKRLIG